jgi:hypothetical protein
MFTQQGGNGPILFVENPQEHYRSKDNCQWLVVGGVFFFALEKLTYVGGM